MRSDNPFKVLSTVQLVQYVQGETIELNSKKSMSPKRKINRVNKLSEARQELVSRLNLLDRNKPEFFPIGAHVQYRNWKEPGKLLGGIVRAHGEKKVHIGFKDQYSTVEVEPCYLKLLYIRTKY